MLENKTYTISELRSIIKESSEFNPKMGDNVVKDDKKNNAKAVDDIMKQAKDFDGGLGNSKGRKTNPESEKDKNKTTLDVNFAVKPSDEYKDRVRAQAHGFASVDNEKNSGKDESADHEGNKDFYDSRQDISKEMSQKRTDIRHAGLKSHNLDKDDFKDNTIYKNESKKMKRLTFKNTTFINEEQVLKRVPDDYKTDGNVFIMRDKTGTDYMVECRIDDRFNFTQLKVTGKMNKQQISEELSRIMQLSNYDSSDYFKTNTAEDRINETKAFGENINKVRELEKKNK